MATQQENNKHSHVINIYRSNPWKAGFITGLFIIILILVLLRLSLPHIIIYNASAWLKHQNIDTTIESLNINLIDGTLSLLNAEGIKEGLAVFNIGRIDIRWQWQPLSNKTVSITKIIVDNFTTNIEQYVDEVTIGGINIAQDNPTATNTKIAEQQDDSSVRWTASLGTVIFNQVNICYQQHPTTHQLKSENLPAIDYCMALEQMNWNGSITYGTDKKLLASSELPISTDGDMSFIGLILTNRLLNKNLLNAKKSNLKGFTLSGLNHIKVKELLINKFSALQRGNKPSDNTVAFNTLAIRDLEYSTNNVSIDTITLDGLAGHVSINKNGELEHNKWRLKNNKQSSYTKTTGQIRENDKTFVVSLNKLNISSERSILFTDNTTDPILNTGLQKLSLEATNLHTAKADTNSPVTLSTKTIDHATIDFTGTVKPFAEKISFDGKGKLKGFDLRIASPATKKTIGHIIQSGQMDADIKLLAKDGKLDSSILLSLYHFNLKAESAQDAEKLDQEFGMPLNQTLLLLRDKDDSIHLDIPITGDVSNPDFEPRDAIIKATSKAATLTLITFYTPYGLIYAGGNVLFDLATAINFDPVAFEPGASEIENNNKEQLDNLAKLMVEKPQIHLTLCGKTNINDSYSLYPELKQLQDKGDLKLTKKQSAALTQLAMSRQVNTKSYLIKETNINHDRLILCTPEHQTHDDAISGVEINI